MRPKLLDLFCGAGGAAMGYHRAGFDVYGVDIDPQPNYPFWFQRGDALTFDLSGFDAIHASPPCQGYSDLQKQNKRLYPKLIEPIRDRLVETGLPYVIENVEGAPLIDPITLCGTMFPGLRVLRHRLFETRWTIHPVARDVLMAYHANPHPLVFTHDKRKGHYGKLDQDLSYVQVTGGGNCTMANALDAMGTPWMKTKHEVNEAIPPAYTQWVGRQLMEHVEMRRAA